MLDHLKRRVLMTTAATALMLAAAPVHAQTQTVNDGAELPAAASPNASEAVKKRRKSAENAEAGKPAKRADKRKQKNADPAQPAKSTSQKATAADQQADESTNRQRNQKARKQKTADPVQSAPAEPQEIETTGQQAADTANTERKPKVRKRVTSEQQQRKVGEEAAPATPAESTLDDGVESTTTAEPVEKTSSGQRSAERAQRRERRQRGDRAAATVTDSKVTTSDEGTETIVRTRSDGAKVTIRRDSSGNVISREVEGIRDRRMSRDIEVVSETREQRSDGSTRIVRKRSDGTTVVIVRDRDGNILRRVVRRPDGSEVVYHGAPRRRYRHDDGVEINVYLPFALPIAPHHYIVQYEDADPRFIEETLLAEPLRMPERSYTVDDVIHDGTVRNYTRRIDLDTIQFEFGSAVIPPQQIGKLQRLAEVLRRIIERDEREVFLIEGHTDAVGSDETNVVLSIERAEAVKQALVDTFDIDPRNLVAEGYGEQYLKVPTQKAEARNRRVAIRRITPLVTSSNAS